MEKILKELAVGMLRNAPLLIMVLYIRGVIQIEISTSFLRIIHIWSLPYCAKLFMGGLYGCKQEKGYAGKGEENT